MPFPFRCKPTSGHKPPFIFFSFLTVFANFGSFLYIHNWVIHTFPFMPITLSTFYTLIYSPNTFAQHSVMTFWAFLSSHPQLATLHQLHTTNIVTSASPTFIPLVFTHDVKTTSIKYSEFQKGVQ
jgi:hypothetical protein